MTDNQTRCGFASLIGAPNAGKSTLINELVGSKISIVTHKVQTTRNRIVGIVMHDNCQIAFVDTPGIFTAKKRLERAMVDAAWQGADEADIVCLLVDAARHRVRQETTDIIDKLKAQNRKAVLILNKVDIADKPKLLELAAKLNESGVFDQTFMISAKTGSGKAELLNYLAQNLPEGPYLYDPESLSDMPMRLFAAEITREKLFLQLQDELPYNLTVDTESYDVTQKGDIKISQVIYITRDSHRAIVLGKGGSRIKNIGKQAREELSKILERKVHLNLFVKVRKNWVENPERYMQWGLDFDAKG